MNSPTSVIQQELQQQLYDTICWLIKSEHSLGGSSAYYAPVYGWSKPYPETTGYMIPTLLDYSRYADSQSSEETAIRFGEWLLSIQSPEGYWHAGLYPPKEKRPSVFNTGQILFGMVSLYKNTGDETWLNSTNKAAVWLATDVDEKGLWKTGHYKGFNPTYYTRVAWPMLLAAEILDDKNIKEKALLVLDHFVEQRKDDGLFRGWGFELDKPAPTHTIAYTLRGFLEASVLLNDWQKYGEKTEQALQRFYELAELNNGRLAGDYGPNGSCNNHYTSLTGNLQMAICLMRWFEQNNDRRLLNASAKLIEYVSKNQASKLPFVSQKGSLAGSKPFWGRYMMFRYPNWSAKFYADALLLFLKLIEKEKKRWSIAES